MGRGPPAEARMWLDLIAVASPSLRQYLPFKHKTVMIRKYSKIERFAIIDK